MVRSSSDRSGRCDRLPGDSSGGNLHHRRRALRSWHRIAVLAQALDMQHHSCTNLADHVVSGRAGRHASGQVGHVSGIVLQRLSCARRLTKPRSQVSFLPFQWCWLTCLDCSGWAVNASSAEHDKEQNPLSYATRNRPGARYVRPSKGPPDALRRTWQQFRHRFVHCAATDA